MEGKYIYRGSVKQNGTSYKWYFRKSEVDGIYEIVVETEKTSKIYGNIYCKLLGFQARAFAVCAIKINDPVEGKKAAPKKAAPKKAAAKKTAAKKAQAVKKAEADKKAAAAKKAEADKKAADEKVAPSGDNTNEKKEDK